MAALLTVFVVVMAVAAFLTVLVVVMAMAALLTVFVVVMAMAALLAVLVVVMAMAALLAVFVVVVLLLLKQRLLQRIVFFHSIENLGTLQLLPRRCDNRCGRIVLPQQADTFLQPVLFYILCAAQNNGAGVLHLIVKKFTEIFHVHFAFLCINHRGKAVQLNPVAVCNALHRLDDIGKFADAGRLDNNAIRGKTLQHLSQRPAEIPNQGAAYTARVHLGNLHARIFEKPAVNADLAEFVFDQNELLPRKSLCQKLFNQSRFSCPEKSGDNIDFCHFASFLSFSICKP